MKVRQSSGHLNVNDVNVKSDDFETTFKMYGGFVEEGGFTSILRTDPFSDQKVRKAFVRKVYSILIVQLVLTAAIAGLFYIPAVAGFAFANVWLFWLAFVLTFVCLIALACFPKVRRKSPGNYICIGIFTLAEGFFLGCVAATYSAEEVFIALAICTTLVLALTIFAWQTKAI